MKHQALLLKSVAVPALLLALQGCHSADTAPLVPEPEDQCLLELSSRHEVTVHCIDDEAFPFAESVTYEPELSSRTADDMTPVRRYIVKAYLRGTRQEVATATAAAPDVRIQLPVGKLDIVAWADYASPHGLKDCYWFSDDFSEMLEHDKAQYRANDTRKAAALGQVSTTIAYNTRSVNVDLANVMAQIRLIATDSPSQKVSKIIVSFPDGVPAAVNAFTGKLCYTWQGVSFLSETIPLGQDRWQIAYSLMPADVDTSTVTVRVEMVDSNGNITARAKGIQVPIRRGCISEVYAPFFSMLERDPAPDNPSGGGIGIDTDFDDNIVIMLKPAL